MAKVRQDALPVIIHHPTFRYHVCFRGTHPKNTTRIGHRRLKRSAYWFLGEYCRQLTGVLPQPSTTNDEKSDTIWPGFLQHGKSPRARQQTAGSDLLGSWSADAVGAGIPGGGLEGVEGGAGSAPRAYPHPIVAAMNGATVSILLRLKHAAMFEDFQVCHRERRRNGRGGGGGVEGGGVG